MFSGMGVFYMQAGLASMMRLVVSGRTRCYLLVFQLTIHIHISYSPQSSHDAEGADDPDVYTNHDPFSPPGPLLTPAFLRGNSAATLAPAAADAATP